MRSRLFFLLDKYVFIHTIQRNIDILFLHIVPKFVFENCSVRLFIIFYLKKHVLLCNLSTKIQPLFKVKVPTPITCCPWSLVYNVRQLSFSECHYIVKTFVPFTQTIYYIFKKTLVYQIKLSKAFYPTKTITKDDYNITCYFVYPLHLRSII